ncbi:MAG: type II toxin-antitoxin system VapC family toxin [Rhodospirillaceae bacterium]
MFLLDTNVLSGLRRPDKANPGLLAWAEQVVPEELFISAITLFEIEVGAALVGLKDVHKGNLLRNWINIKVLPEFSGRILPIDTDVARRCAMLHVPHPRPMRDSMIAVTTIVHGLTVVTRSVPDFENTGARLLNPWTESG